MESVASQDWVFFRYAPVLAADLAWGLSVTGGGYTFIPPGSPYPPVRHPTGYQFSWELGRALEEWQLVFLGRGEGEFQSRQGGRLTVKAGDCFVLFPGEWHRYRPNVQTGWDEHWVGFVGELPKKWVQERYLDPRKPVFTSGLDPGLFGAFAAIHDGLRRQPPGWAPVAAARVMEAVARCVAARHPGCGEDPVKTGILDQVLALFQAHPEIPLDMGQVAARLQVSQTWLRRAFLRRTGLPPKQYLLELRFARAKGFLLETQETVKAISAACGFARPAFFVHAFKVRTGLTPAAWRLKSRSGFLPGDVHEK
jgi:AraC-like DNA-binding protein